MSETTGKKLSIGTFSNEIRALARTAGVEQETVGHMFRHRYITRLFIMIIKRHKFNNPEEFRQALIDIEGIKAEIKEYTGHSSLKSLDRYITYAFNEITGFGETLNAVEATNIIASFERFILKNCIGKDSGTPQNDFQKEIASCATATIEALKACIKKSCPA